MTTTTKPAKRGTTTRSTKPATPAQNLHRLLVKSNHASIYRLAEQLDLSPHELAAEIMAAGIAALDWSLHDNGRVALPLTLACTDAGERHDFDISARMNSMTPEEMLELEEQAGSLPLQAMVRTDGKLPIYFPSETVRLLEGLCDASGFGDIERYAEEFLGSEIHETLDSRPGRECGVIEIIAGSYQLYPGDTAAMQAVVNRWNNRPLQTVV